MKEILGIFGNPTQHWVGDGFPVRTLFSHDTLGRHISPFLLLDYAGPTSFAPATAPRGVGQHPHRGFETVTIVYQGEVEHRDSTGNGGRIGPGDVQWMTAAAGILHDEFHSDAFTHGGGMLEMVQLWVNLPAADKMKPAGYQAIAAADIPSAPLPGGAGQVRVIAGSYDGHDGPAHTFTPMDVWDVRLKSGSSTELRFAPGRTLGVVVLRGNVVFNGEHAAGEAQIAVFDSDGADIAIAAGPGADAVLLVLSGEPIDEAVVMHGPFVMNSAGEIRQAIADFNSGRFGNM